MRVVGVDGYPRGWVVVALDDGRFAAVELVTDLTEALTRFPTAEVVGVDVPIGLPEREREADRAARDLLGPRRSSVFPTPPRAVLEQASHAEAVAECRRLGLPGLSAQSYALRRKILEADELARGDERVVEVHPEVSFAAMAGQPVVWAKKTWNGLNLRRSLLAGAGVVLPDEVSADAPAVDLLDAAAAAWSAHRYGLGQALPLPIGAATRIGAIWR